MVVVFNKLAGKQGGEEVSNFEAYETNIDIDDVDDVDDVKVDSIRYKGLPTRRREYK